MPQPIASPAPSLWTQLESLGLHEIVMVERMKALRALANASGGPLSTKQRPEEPVMRQLGKVLKTLIADAGEPELAFNTTAAKDPRAKPRMAPPLPAHSRMRG